MSASKTGHQGRLLLVLGMHRSGTSLLSGLLAGAGLDLGNSIMGPAEDNPKGFWENERIVALNEQLLNTLAQTWSSYEPLPDGWQEGEDAKVFRQELSSLLDEEFETRDNICIKDPRLCRLLPVWRELADELGLQVHCTSIVRPEAEVAASLEKRDSLGREHARALWLRYNLDMLTHSEGLPLYRTSYDALLENADRALAALSDELEWELSAADAELVDAGLRHHNAPEQPDACDALYSALSEQGVPVPEFIQRDVLPMATRLAELETRLTRQATGADTLDEDSLASARERQLFEQAQDAKQYAGSMERELETGRGYIEAMEAELKERQAYAENLEQEMAARDNDIETKAEFIASLEKQIAVLDADLAERAEFVSSLQSELETIQRDLDERATYVQSLTDTVAAKDADLKALNETIAGERAGHEAFVAAHEEDIARREEYTQSLLAEIERQREIIETKTARVDELEHKFRHLIRLGRALKGQAQDHEQ